MALEQAFVWGRNGAKLTAEEIARREEQEEALRANGIDVSPVGHWTQGLARVVNAAAGAYRRGELDQAKSENQAYSDAMRGKILDRLTGGSETTSAAAVPMAGAGQELAATNPALADVSQNGETFSPFIDTVRSGGLTNPYGLAAVASTGKAESGWSAENANRTWSDPSESGQPGTAGGIMSWRGPRYNALAATGDLSPQGQAKFFLQENPQLIAQLQKAGSVEEAQNLMNRAWAFAGYDRPGGESARRLGYAKGYLPQFQGAGAQVASLDPAAGATTAPAAIEAIAPQEPSFDAGRWGDPIKLAEMPAGMDDAVQRLGAQAEAYTPPSAPTVAPQPVANPPAVAQQPVQMAGGRRPSRAVPPMNRALLEALTDRRLDPGVRQMADILVRQQQTQRQAAQEEQSWYDRQDYLLDRQRSDPKSQIDLERSRLELDAARNGQWSRLDDGRLFNQRTGEFKDAPVNPNAAPSDLGLNPQYGTDANGNPVLLQLGKNGKVVQSQMPDGVSLSKEPIRLDAGTHFVLLDPITRQPVGQIPKENYQAAFDTATGTTEGKARADAMVSLPADLQQAQQTLENIDKLLKSPGLSSIVGSLDQYRPSWTMGAQGKDALARLEQLQGGAFLQAFGMLKGAGQITEIEGTKAEKATARMNRALSEDEFKTALMDFRDALSAGMDKMRQRATMPPRSGKPASAPNSVPDPLGIR